MWTNVEEEERIRKKKKKKKKEKKGKWGYHLSGLTIWLIYKFATSHS
jgi:hypothetical protein